MFKRVFSTSRQPDSVSKSVRMTLNMWEAIEKLSKEQGETPNRFITTILDKFLQDEVAAGRLKMPKKDAA